MLPSDSLKGVPHGVTTDAISFHEILLHPTLSCEDTSFTNVGFSQLGVCYSLSLGGRIIRRNVQASLDSMMNILKMCHPLQIVNRYILLDAVFVVYF